jgi:hypothetical protein
VRIKQKEDFVVLIVGGEDTITGIKGKMDLCMAGFSQVDWPGLSFLPSMY